MSEKQPKCVVPVVAVVVVFTVIFVHSKLVPCPTPEIRTFVHMYIDYVCITLTYVNGQCPLADTLPCSTYSSLHTYMHTCAILWFIV